jgi:hypothetical protein
MEFLYPGILYALAALAIPVIVHLFNFRRHRLVYFSRIDLLKNLVQQTSKTNKLKHLVVLMLRILAFSALIIAFAGPYLPKSPNAIAKEENLISVYLDNSLSMSLKGANGSLFDEARQMAVDLAQSVNKNDRFLLITNDMLPEHEYTMTREEFIREIGSITPSTNTASLSVVHNRMKQLTLSESGARSAFLISDFQKTSADLANLIPDTAITTYFVPTIAQSYQNVFIDSCWLNSPVLFPGQSVSLTARVYNEGGTALKNQSLALLINNSRKAIANFDLEANSFSDIELQFVVNDEGWQNASLQITDFPVVFDDEMFLSFEVSGKLNVLEITGNTSGKWIEMLASGDPLFTLTRRNIFQLDFQSFVMYHLIVLNELEQIPDGLKFALDQYIEDGGKVLVAPAATQSARVYNQWLSGHGVSYAEVQDTTRTRVFSLQTAHPLFRDVFVSIPDNPDLPLVFKHYPIKVLRNENSLALITMINGGPFLSEISTGQGKIYMIPVPLNDNWTNFHRNPLFVPVFYRMAFLQPGSERLYHIAGNNSIIEIPFIPSNAEQIIKIAAPDSLIWIPQQRNFGGITQFSLSEGPVQPGHHRLISEDSTIAFFSVNLDRSESRLSCWNQDELTKEILSAGFEEQSALSASDIGKSGVKKLVNPGSMLWKWFVLMTLLFLLLEVLVLRFWK